MLVIENRNAFQHRMYALGLWLELSIEKKSVVRELNDLLPALQQLDHLLEKAVASAPVAEGDPYRGLYIDREGVDRALTREPATSPFETEPETVLQEFEEITRHSAPLTWLKETFCLSVAEVVLILIALAPEIDLRYERIYAYLQDDVTRRYPTVELALNLLGSSVSTKLANRNYFATAAPLIEQRLLWLVPDPNHVHPPLLSHYLKVDEQLIRMLLGQAGLDSRLKPFSQLVIATTSLDHVLLAVETKQALLQLTEQAWQTQQPLVFYFHGPQGVGKQKTAAAIAAHLGIPLLTTHLVMAANLNLELEPTLNLLLREAQYQSALLYIQHFDQLLSQVQPGVQSLLMTLLINHAGIVVLAGNQPRLSALPATDRVLDIQFPMPDFSQRRQYWQMHLLEAGIDLESSSLDALSDRFRLTAAQMDSAIALAKNRLRWSSAMQAAQPSQSNHAPSLVDLFSAARQQSSQTLSDLANKINLKYTWDDIILPADQLTQLREICNQVKHRQIVYGQWGFERKLSLGKGVNVLFSGPPGTGKTMASDVIANELQLDLYKIDLSQVVSKYIGETEKNLDRIFTAAQTANAILFFDEADALFGKRSEVKDAHDRYANIEVGYLLQKMEEYEGLAILATNLRQNLDDAFVRRLHFVVDFPFPDEAHRRRIWEVLFPQEAPVHEEVDFDRLSSEIKLAGGNLKNIALSAAFYAAEEHGMIQMRHLLQASQREHQKLGQNWQMADWNM